MIINLNTDSVHSSSPNRSTSRSELFEAHDDAHCDDVHKNVERSEEIRPEPVVTEQVPDKENERKEEVTIPESERRSFKRTQTSPSVRMQFNVWQGEQS